MFEKMSKTHASPCDQCPANEDTMPLNHKALLADIERIFTEARPRLLQLAYARRMSPDLADDVVQETLMEAWRHIEKLRDPQRIHAWLDGICRNVCRRYQSDAPHESLDALDETHTEALLARTDPSAIDPAEELSQRDGATLLDRAMAHLPPEVRRLLELCYLAELPQREVALHMGLTIGALEVRLHRARKQLRQVLNGPLRADALSFGLALDPRESLGWRETRQWCWLCGTHRLRGLFETQAGGYVALRLRCPACFSRYGFDVIHSGGLVPMAGLRSFRPALKRLYQTMGERSWLPLKNNLCFCCQEPALVSVIPSADVSFLVPPDRYWICTACPTCGMSTTDISTLFISYPQVTRFLLQYKRCVVEPYQLCEYEGRPAVCIRLASAIGGERLTVLLDLHTLQLLTAR